MTKSTKKPSAKAEAKWDDSQRRWIASATDSGGRRLTALGSSTTQAFGRLSQMLVEAEGSDVSLDEKLHIPKALDERFKVFAKRLPEFVQLKEYISRERIDLARILTNDYRIPVSQVAKLLGMSSQRLGMLLKDADLATTQGGSSRSRQSDRDD